MDRRGFLQSLGIGLTADVTYVIADDRWLHDRMRGAPAVGGTVVATVMPVVETPVLEGPIGMKVDVP